VNVGWFTHKETLASTCGQAPLFKVWRYLTWHCNHIWRVAPPIVACNQVWGCGKEAARKPARSPSSYTGPSSISWLPTPSSSILQEVTASLKGDVHQTFVNIMTANTFVICLLGRGSPAQRQNSRSVRGPTDGHWSRAHRGIQRPTEVTCHRRSPRMKPPSRGHVSTYDW
jgi:hypothetical protein